MRVGEECIPPHHHHSSQNNNKQQTTTNNNKQQQQQTNTKQQQPTTNNKQQTKHRVYFLFVGSNFYIQIHFSLVLSKKHVNITKNKILPSFLPHSLLSSLPISSTPASLTHIPP
jgi:hypothetical protein